MEGHKNPRLERISWVATIVSTIIAVIGLALFSSDSGSEKIIFDSSGDKAVQIGKVEGDIIIAGEKTEQKKTAPTVLDDKYDTDQKREGDELQGVTLPSVESPVARNSPSVPTAIYEEREDAVEMAPKDGSPVQPRKAEVFTTSRKIEEQSTFPQSELVASEHSKPRQSDPDLSFLLHTWRLFDESCFRTRRFGIVGEVIEEHDANRNLVYSGRIKSFDGTEVRINDGSRFIIKGEELHHVKDQSIDIFLRC